MYTVFSSSSSSILTAQSKSRSRSTTCNFERRTTSSPSFCSFSKSPSLPSSTSILSIAISTSTNNDNNFKIDTSRNDLLHHCFYGNAQSIKGAHGSFGRGTITLERAPLDLSQDQPTKIEPLLDSGDNGGDNGRIGGIGGRGGGGNDDDEYNWNNIDPDDDGGDDGNYDPFAIFRLRGLVPEIFDKQIVDSVLSEWMKTMKDLPLGLKQAYTMGMLSSAQFTRFLWFNSRPSMSRVLCRALPEGLSRDFSGKITADPSLPYKLFLEAFTSIGFSLLFDTKQRGIENMKKEWNLVLINAATIATCNTFVVWSVAPCYRYGGGFGFQWLNNLMKLPNNVFEKSYRFHEFNLQRRALSYFYKAINLFTLGVAIRTCQIGLSAVSSSSIDKEKKRLMISNMGVNAVGAGLSVGLYSNLRYQLLNGIDRGLVSYFDVVGVPFYVGSAIRVLNAKIGAQSIGYWMGNEQLLSTNENDGNASNWLDLKSVIYSGIGLVDACTKVQSLLSNKGKKKRSIKKKMVPLS